MNRLESMSILLYCTSIQLEEKSSLPLHIECKLLFISLGKYRLDWRQVRHHYLQEMKLDHSTQCLYLLNLAATYSMHNTELCLCYVVCAILLYCLYLVYYAHDVVE